MRSENIMKIKVKPEGRAGVWTADKDSVVDFLMNYEHEEIHNFLPGGGMMIGCDFSKSEAIKQVKDAERLAILTGESLVGNMRHALSVIVDNKLSMFDIGEITESDLLVA